MNEKDEITSKGEDKHRNKFIIIVGKDTNNNFLGVVVINSKINLLWTEYDFQYELKWEKYKDVFEHNSYVNCSSIRPVNPNRLNKKKGTIDKWDYEAIVDKIKKHPKISKHILKKYNLINH
jgi:mRNA-degrading endonuclease toxin of MazEF toxin-antitoxin module